jgi:hypothetical protein
MIALKPRDEEGLVLLRDQLARCDPFRVDDSLATCTPGLRCASTPGLQAATPFGVLLLSYVFGNWTGIAVSEWQMVGRASVVCTATRAATRAPGPSLSFGVTRNSRFVGRSVWRRFGRRVRMERSAEIDYLSNSRDAMGSVRSPV